jgi:hypothetical protein
VADDDLAYLSSLSEHPNRPGDVSNMNPAFAGPLANALRQANAQGLKLGVMSGYRDPGQTGSAYDAGGNSSHTYGLASDISGLDGPNGTITNQWAQIAGANGLHNPYGVGNTAEFNHWQLPAQPLEQTPQLLASLKAAKATGNFQNVWNAYNGASGTGSPAIANAPAKINPGLTINSSPLAGSHAQFIQDYAKSIGLDPNLALGIANAEGLKAWSASNPNAASTVDVENGKPFSFGDFQLNVHPGAMGSKAIAAGVNPSDPTQWQAADKYALDQMKAGGVGPWKGDPVAAAYLQSGQAPGPIDPSILARGGTSPPIPGAPATPAAPATAATPGVLPGFPGKAQSDAFTQGATALDKAMHGDQSAGQQEEGGQAAAFNFPQARNVHPLLGMSSQIYGNTLNSMATPLQWSSATPGQSPYANVGGAPIGQQFGTQLSSIDQMRQMMAMMGSPYANPTGT